MKHRYIESLLSEIELLASKVEILKESKRVPFTFFKESFKRTQEITRLLHELEFVQIEEMRGEMEKLVQYLSDSEKTKKAAEVKAKSLAAKVKELEVESEKEEQIVEANDVTDEVEQKEEIEETLATTDEVETPMVEDKDDDKNKDKPLPSHSTSLEKPEETTQSSTPLLNNLSERVLADIAPKNKSLNDVQPVSQTVQDVKRSISLNDRFLFQRELFDNNRDAMNTMLTKLQAFSSFDLVESYLKRNTTWDFSNETVDKFLQMFKDRFK